MCATIGTGEDRRVRLIAMLAGALVLTLALASGCGPKYPNCATDGHCNRCKRSAPKRATMHDIRRQVNRD